MALRIVISGVYGGEDAGAAARLLVQEVKDALREPLGAAGEDLELRIQLYVSGEVTRYEGPLGLTSTRLFLAKARATCEVTMGSELWADGRAAVVGLLTTSLRDAVVDVARRLAGKGVGLDAGPVVEELEHRLRPLAQATRRRDG